MVDLEPVGCFEHDHAHQSFEMHLHNDRVLFPDGSAVTAVSYDVLDPYARGHRPDHGLYLDLKWEPPWPHEHLDWPNFGVPDDSATVVSHLTSALQRARAGELVEIGCIGGHGRTGTALACIAVLTEIEPDEAVGWVRSHYCSEAVETPVQESFVLELFG